MSAEGSAGVPGPVRTKLRTVRPFSTNEARAMSEALALVRAKMVNAYNSTGIDNGISLIDSRQFKGKAEQQ